MELVSVIRSAPATRGYRRAWRGLGAAAAISAAIVLGSCGDPTGPSRGSMIVTISGLPDDAAAAVSVWPRQATGSPPPTTIFELTRTDTLEAITPAIYAIQADVVEIDGVRWVPTPATQEVDVPASSQAVTASVTYALGETRLAVIISGLPTGANAAVSVAGPGGYTRTLTVGETLTGLAAGTYTISAAPVTTDGGASWRSPVPTTRVMQIVAGTVSSTEVAYSTFGLRLEPIATGLFQPVHLAAPAGDTRLFIVEQPGRIRIVKAGQLLATPFLDISAHVRCCGEEGLLSVAFDPQYATTGYFWVYFTDVNGNIAIRRHHATPTSDVADADSLPVLNIPHPQYTNHNGGLMMFGPDNLLYIGTGDGGGGGDPSGNAQNLGSLLGKLLRIDVRTTPPYSIPAANPFVGQSGRRGEVWAYGLRNPWRFDLDPAAGAAGNANVWIADVGQARFEEINVAFSNPAGVNYGWNVMEGLECYVGTTCDRTGLHLPAISYGHTLGCSITGGHVYRGSAIPELAGEYFYSDYCRGWISSVKGGTPSELRTREWITSSVGNVTSFGEDGAGELYVIVAAGTVYRLVRR